MPEEPDWYESHPNLAEFSQGDVLRGIPFPRWPTFLTVNDFEKTAVLRPLRSGNLSTAPSMNRLPNHFEARAQKDFPDAFSNFERSEYVVAQCRLRDVIILSRSCSLDNTRRKHIVVAPVTAIEDLPEVERSDAKLYGLRANDIPQCFYLPATKDMKEAVADLLMITYLHRKFLNDDNVKSQLVARLSSYGNMRLQQQLATHFGTKFGYDYEDLCPATGTYSCSACFHAGRNVSRINRVEGNPFGPCGVCGEHAAFIKVG